MVSLQIPFIQLNQRNTILESEGNNNSNKKRKWDHDPETEDILHYKQWMSTPTATATAAKSLFDVNLETPLPSEWQRCLDIQSGEVHFYNTRTQKRTMTDPRKNEEPSSPRMNYCHMSLDLELNLPCGSLNQIPTPKTSQLSTHNKMNKCSSSSPRASTKSHVVDDTVKDDEEEVVEMVATACMRCHMLVMLQKSAPTCPNCKFIHPPYQRTTSTPELFNPRLSLS
ncbi:hypothetical protein vseg_021060 [Gypsophila vaccaria]